MVERPRPITLGADKTHDTADFVNELRTLKVTPHVAQNESGRVSAIDGRTTRHAGYAVSHRIRKRIEEAFGWMKIVGGQAETRLRGLERVGFAFTFTAAAYNLVRLPKLLEAPASDTSRIIRSSAAGASSRPISGMAIISTSAGPAIIVISTNGIGDEVVQDARRESSSTACER